MRTDSLFDRYELYVSGAIVAAHASNGDSGFRQRDVRFMIELFTNWIESSLDSDVLKLSNTQILRYLDKLVEEGFVRKVLKDGKPSYRLTRPGLIELVARMRGSKTLLRPENFSFLHYFLSSYQELVTDLVESEGSKFPIALKIEIKSLFDTRDLISEQKKRLEQEIFKLRVRVDEGKKSAQLASDLFRKGQELQQVAETIEEKYPYGLNSQKPLKELIGSIPVSLGRWELETGGENRARYLWQPMLRYYERQLENLQKS